jgi:hypothetical protein
MPRRRWFWVVTRLTALIVTGVSFVGLGSAQAGKAPAEQTGSLKPLAVVQATTEQIKAMAAQGSGELMTFEGASNGTADAGIMDITCYLSVGTPYGGGAPDADILVDAIVFCDWWVHAASLQIQLYRDNSLVASDGATFPYTYGVAGTVGVTECTAGTYFGAATAVVARYDHYPPVIGATKRSADVQIGCG